MPFALLAESPLGFIAWVVAILSALSFHEFSHALMGDFLGDRTARRSGRLTLNPLAHIDPLGFMLLILVGFGWGKPVPFDPFELRYPKWGPTLVAFAGPLANLFLAALSGLALKILNAVAAFPIDNFLIQFLHLMLFINVILMTFNLIPIPPLDGSKFLLSLLAAPRFARSRYFLETRGPLIILAIVLADSFLGIGLLSRLFGFVLNFVYRLV